MSDTNTPVVGLVVPALLDTQDTVKVILDSVRERLADTLLSGEPCAMPVPLVPRMHGKRRLRTRGPGKGKRAECVLLLDIAIQALQAAKERALGVTADMPMHERVRLLVPVLSDAGLAMRSVEEAAERWGAGKV